MSEITSPNGESYSGAKLASELAGIEKGKQPQDIVASFETAQGSVYRYDADGRTTRFKTATGEMQSPQDLTVFVDLSLEQQQDVLQAYRTKNLKEPTKVYIVERQDDNTPKIVRTLADIKKPDALFLAIYRNGVMAENQPCSLFPKEGSNVFDTRHFNEDGKSKTERHLGNKVVKIYYK